MGLSFLGQTLIKVEPNKVKWVAKLQQKWNLIGEFNGKDLRKFNKLKRGSLPTYI